MNEKNFNSISQFEVPKSWIDGALSVPATHKKKTFPLIKLTRTLAAVACLVLVCGLSVALYFITDDSSIPPVKEPIATENYIIDGSSDTDETNNINKENENSSENNEINKGENPTSSGLENDEVNTQNGTGSHPEPNEKPQKPTPDKPDKPQKPDSTKPSESQKPTHEKPDEPPIETEAPTEGKFPPPWTPTESPTHPKPPIDPNEPPWDDPIEPPWENPTEAPTESPTESTTEEPTIDKDFRVFARVDENKLTGSQKVYCAFYDPNGVLVGDNNMIAPFRLMEKGFSYGGTVDVIYYPYRMLDITVSGKYRYIFYNERREILYENTTYLTAEK